MTLHGGDVLSLTMPETYIPALPLFFGAGAACLKSLFEYHVANMTHAPVPLENEDSSQC